MTIYIYIHNILHRDLQPSNILLDQNLCPKLSNIGLCMKNHDANTISFRSTCGTKGQPSYSAPEILLHGEYMKSSDVYSFGLVVYEIIQKKIFVQSLTNK